MTNTTHEHDTGYERLIMFTDGIFAIAATLLALEIRLPEMQNRAELGNAILSLTPQIFVFVLSFAQVGIFWIAHQATFRFIERSDARFITLNLIYLMLIAFMPVPSAILGRFGDVFEAVEFFAVTLLLIGLMEIVVWEYAAYNKRLLRPDVTPAQIALVRWRTYNLIGVFGISILIAFISPLLAMLSWILTFVFRILIVRRFERPAH